MRNKKTLSNSPYFDQLSITYGTSTNTPVYGNELKIIIEFYLILYL